MDFDDHPSETEETEPKVFKLLSETDIQVAQDWGVSDANVVQHVDCACADCFG